MKDFHYRAFMEKQRIIQIKETLFLIPCNISSLGAVIEINETFFSKSMKSVLFHIEKCKYERGGDKRKERIAVLIA